MSWVPLAATFVGAVIGLGASLLTDNLRWGRERTDRSLSARREVYVAYLTSLHTANQALRASALGDRPGDQPLDLYARAVFVRPVSSRLANFSPSVHRSRWSGRPSMPTRACVRCGMPPARDKALPITSRYFGSTAIIFKVCAMPCGRTCR